MFSGRHFVHSVIPAARTLASNLSFPDLQEMMPQRARRPLHESALGSPILATVAEAGSPGERAWSPAGDEPHDGQRRSEVHLDSGTIARRAFEIPARTVPPPSQLSSRWTGNRIDAAT